MSFEADILDRVKMREIFQMVRPDGVIHLAARAGVTEAEASDAAAQSYFDVNVKGTDVITQLCNTFGVSFFANAGSSSEFGSQAWDGRSLRPQSEKSRLVPEGNYGRTKVFSEMLLSARALGNASAQHTLVTTFFNPIGTGERGLLVPLMTRKLLGFAAQRSGQFTVYDQYRRCTPVNQTLEHLFRGVERMLDAGPNYAKLDYQHCGGGITSNNRTIAELALEALGRFVREKQLFEGIDFNEFACFTCEEGPPCANLV
jgi:UDP-glucuronate 4-epimerase